MAPEMSDARYEHRRELVAAVFEQVEHRPGVTVALDGVSITVTETVPCAVSGAMTTMCWDDEEQGEQLHDLIADPAVPDEALDHHAARAALTAVIGNDLHELAEWFHLDGRQVFDPHPDGRRYGGEPFTAHILIDTGPPPAPHTPAGSWAEISPGAARRAAAQLCERVTIGGPTRARFELRGGTLTHIGCYPDRDTGELREWAWSVEPFDDYRVPAGGNTAAALRARLVADMFDLAAQSAAHEAAEWLTLDGRRVFDPHPEPHTQRDRVRVVLAHHTSIVVAPTAAAVAARTIAA